MCVVGRGEREGGEGRRQPARLLCFRLLGAQGDTRRTLAPPRLRGKRERSTNQNTPTHVTQVDPDLDGPTLPSAAADEFRPFVRRLPEFKFWWAATRSFALGFAATFFPLLDVPVFWPILVAYFFALFFVTMKRQIRHMLKHRYVPFSWGKKAYGKGGAAARPVE